MAGACEITVRKATPADAETVLTLHVDAVTSQCRTHYSPEQIDGWFAGRTPEAYARAIEAGALWIAEVAAKPVGFVEVFPGLVSMLFVSGDWAGRGIGGQLMAFALPIARQGGDGAVRLKATLNARTFYERLGFVKVGDSQMSRASGLTLPTISMMRPA